MKNSKLTWLLPLISLIGGISLGLVYNTQPPTSQCKKKLNHEEVLDISKGKKFTEITYNPPGRVKRLFYSNISTKVVTSEGLSYNVETNNLGLRDEKIASKHEEYRILILGDSTAFGWGINETNRFPEILNRRLEKNLDKEVQFIVAAVPGWGLKDQYLFLKENINKIEPDLIISTVSVNDMFGVKDTQILIEKIQDKCPEYSNKSIKKAVKKIKKDKIFSTKLIQEIKTDMQEINSISQKNSVKNIYLGRSSFILIDLLAIKSREVFLLPPDRIGELEYKISENDYHPNKKGHKLLAKTLYPVLKSNLEGRSKNVSLYYPKKELSFFDYSIIEGNIFIRLNHFILHFSPKSFL